MLLINPPTLHRGAQIGKFMKFSEPLTFKKPLHETPMYPSRRLDVISYVFYLLPTRRL